LRKLCDLWLALLLFAGTLALYSPVRSYDFVNYDDPDYVTANPHVPKGITADGLAWAFGRLHGDKTYWHPLTWTSHMLDCQLFGLRAGWHHMINVLFHALNAALLFGVLRQMTGAVWRSWLVAALFSVHPLQVDTVAWITERKNVLSAMFWLLAMWGYVRYASVGGRRSPSPPFSLSPFRKQSWYALTLAFFILGLMSKPVLITFPFAMLLLDVWPLNRIRWPTFARDVRIAVPEKLPFFALAAFNIWVTVHGHAVGWGVTQSTHGLPLLLRIENAFVSYVRYLGKIIWPSKLAVLYPHPGQWQDAAVIGSVILVIGITAVVLWEFHRRPYVAIGWFWFIGNLVPAMGILQFGVQAMADRFVYLPIIGIFIAIVWGISDLLPVSRVTHHASRILSAAVLIVLAIVTSRQLPHWRNSIALYEHTLSVTSNNFVIHNNLGYTLLHSNRVDDAIPHFREALRIRPDFPAPALQLAQAHALKQQWTEAIAYFEKALALQPNTPAALKGYADALVQTGRFDAAVAQYEALLKVVPIAESHAHLALALIQAKRPAEAIPHYRSALALAPDAYVLLNNLAWLLATHPEDAIRDGPEAVRLATRACELTNRKEPVYLGTLAAAYAETGNFDEAVRTGQQAAALAETAGKTELAARNRELVESYKSDRPHREKDQ
jgi:protein O-mannosyl-transferase